MLYQESGSPSHETLTCVLILKVFRTLASQDLNTDYRKGAGLHRGLWMVMAVKRAARSSCPALADIIGETPLITLGVINLARVQPLAMRVVL